MSERIVDDFGCFEPHPLLPGGHVQTLAGVFFPGEQPPYAARRQRVRLPDGDQVVLHDDCPPGWWFGDRTALLVHGLGGSYGSSYMVRIAARLNAQNVRTFRMDLRGGGAGAECARLPYHAGRSEDVAEALIAIARLCPGSPTALVGFSLGGNIALKLLGELGGEGLGNLDRAMAICPPIEPAACVNGLDRFPHRLYDRYFVGELWRQLRRRARMMPSAVTVVFPRRPRRIREFDDLFTGPVCGFGDSAGYYQRCRTVHLIPEIRLPTLILTAADDPLVPVEQFKGLMLASATHLLIAPGGGHLGFLARASADPDRRWMDWRVLDWVLAGAPASNLLPDPEDAVTIPL